MSSEIDGDGKALLRKQVRARPALLRQLAGGGKTLGEQINYAGRATDFEQAARPSMAEHTVERGEASRATIQPMALPEDSSKVEAQNSEMTFAEELELEDGHAFEEEFQFN
ncbi:unnamed protein product [Miscanthus lutarioriparius]|uniref:Uncharacterized protein n=1 Tax=Miscanthus lutarioriparius TaxID=422564 RepID=A0A811NEN1_9POAL|nr:unnamed protein product [Miscanthus lutarioriparius]CAD6340921.1 unnamed protein product [Miscanthus lutarioriparius]